MSWLQKLYQTYPNILSYLDGETAPWPNAHIKKNAHIEVILDEQGNFRHAEQLSGTDAATIIPVTEKSCSRTGNIAAHPLCEELSYCALDLSEGVKKKAQRNTDYLTLLSDWCASEYAHPKALAVKKYIEQGRLWADIVSRQFEFPLVFKTASTQKIIPAKCFVRWRIEKPGEPISGTWEDPKLIQAWIAFEQTLNPKRGFCFIQGKETRLAKFHPKFIRHAADGARFITQNDWEGFTFKGRFTDAKKDITENNLPSQVAEVSFEVTQKAHNALRWLIHKQGYRNADQAVICWAISNKKIPDPMQSSWDNWEEEENTTVDHSIDLGQSFALKLNKYLSGYGYKTQFNDKDQITILALDSATPGRLAITYYQEMLRDDYLANMEKWYTDFAWFQRRKQEIQENNGKKQTIWPISTPSPRDIYEAIFGAAITDQLKKQTVQRLLPCIVEGQAFPEDLMQGAVRKAINRHSYPKDDQWLWEKNLGIACALFKGFVKRKPSKKYNKEYNMGLEKDNDNRDYLFGRLLAIAERIEDIALSLTDEKRSTNAARLMQRFADRPAATWRILELALNPYIQRLKVNRGGFLHNIQSELDEIMGKFDSAAFTTDKPLSPEFLLAFHAQRLEFRKSKEDKKEKEAAAP